MDLVRLRLSVTNCYLFANGERFVLIDTGYEEDWNLFLACLDEARVRLSDISHIILTHHHDDHCGLLNKIVALNPAVIVVMTELTRDLLLTGKNDDTRGGGLLNRRIAFLVGLKQLYLSMVLGKRIDKSKNLTFPPYHARQTDLVLSGETTLAEIGIHADGKVIGTPGHTIDSISIVFAEGHCVAGDAAANFLCCAGTRNCVIFIMDLEMYYRSWERILAEKTVTMYPAHGKPFPAERLTKNIGKNRKEHIVATGAKNGISK